MAFPATTTRYLLFLCNLLFLVSAIAIAVVAALIGWSFFRHDVFIDQNFLSPPLIILGACAIIGIVSLFGCCGVIKENRCCLILFSILLFAVVVGEFIAGIYIYNTKDEIANTVKTRMETSMLKYNKTGGEVETRSWNVLQIDFHCCGVKNYTDWYETIGRGKLPQSCCSNIALEDKCTEDFVNRQGCYIRFAQFLHTKSLTLAVVVLSVGVAQLLCAVASGLLARYIKVQYEAV